jgi:hypothetical protein
MKMPLTSDRGLQKQSDLIESALENARAKLWPWTITIAWFTGLETEAKTAYLGSTCIQELIPSLIVPCILIKLSITTFARFQPSMPAKPPLPI